MRQPTTRIQIIIQELLKKGDPVSQEAAQIMARMQELKLKLEKRIRNQRKENQVTWEIVEMRRKYMGSPEARKAFARLLKRNNEHIKTITKLEQEVKDLTTIQDEIVSGLRY